MTLTERNSKLATVALTAIFVCGCGSTHRRRSDYGDLQTRTPAIGDDTTSVDKLLVRKPMPTPSGETLPASYDEKILVATPVALPLTNGQEDPQNSTASNVEVFASFNESLPPPTEEAQPVDYFVTLALAQHPSIQAARQRVSAELNRIPQARALPDPMFNNTFWPIHDQSLQTAAGRIGNQMSLSQAIPWPKKLRTKAAIVSQEVQIARAEVERIERQITEAVRLAYYEVWFATRAMAIIEEMKDLVDDLNQVAEARYRSGGTQQDVLRARLESDRLEDQLIGLTKQQQVAQADLAALVQQPVTLFPEASEDLGLNDVPGRLDELIALAEQCNPELLGLAWEVQRDRQKQRLACLQKYPDLQVGLHWGLVSDDHKVLSPVADGHDTISFNVGTTLPIWHDKIDSGVREAAHRTSSTTRRLDARRDALSGQIRRLLAQADAFIEQRDVYKTRIIPRSEDTLTLSLADYRGKRTDFFSLIETYRELLMFETQLARINASLAGTIAQIERVVGCE